MYGTDELTLNRVYLSMAYSRFVKDGHRSWDGYYLPNGSLIIECWPMEKVLHAELTPSDTPHLGTMVELRVWETGETVDPQWLIEPETHHLTRDIVARLKKLGFSTER